MEPNQNVIDLEADFEPLPDDATPTVDSDESIIRVQEDGEATLFLRPIES